MFARRHRSPAAPVKPVTSHQMMEGLESRVLMAATQPHFTNFASIAGLRGNGFGNTTPLNDTKKTLLLTDGGNYESRSVFWTQQVPVETFSTTFSFVSTAAAQTADGLTFVVQNYGTNAHGHSGANLGYAAPSLKKSVAVAFNLYNGSAYGSQFGFASGGSIPLTNTDMTPVDLHNGHIFNAAVSYDGKTLSVRVTDSANPANTFKSSEVVNIPKAIGNTMGYVGFTASTGVQISTQKVTSWSYTGSNGGTITKHAKAKPKTAAVNVPITLSVRGNAPGGESSIKYTWSVTTLPGGAKAPKFAANSNNASKVTTVKFFKAGRYVVKCTLTDAFGNTFDSNSVVVKIK